MKARLVRIFPELQGARFQVETTDLGGNAWNTRSVQRHRIRTADGRVLECIEKKIARVLGVPPFEPFMQARAASLNRPGALIRVPHLGVIDTPFASYLYSDFVAGTHAHLARVAATAAAGLAAMEASSARQLQEHPGSGTLDFFRPWTLWRPRYNVAFALRSGALRNDPALRGILGLAQRMRPHLRSLAGEAARSLRCHSHLDLLSKNLVENGEGLHLVDWGEGRVGRFGFDAGSYLHRLLRGNDLETYGSARDVFVESYFAQLPSAADRGRVQKNLTWFLATRTLCYFLRPEVLRQHRAAPGAVEEKLAMLLAQLEAVR